jgi:hypothetical protein
MQGQIGSQDKNASTGLAVSLDVHALDEGAANPGLPD